MWPRKESTFETFDRVIMVRFLDTGGEGWDSWGGRFFRRPRSLHTQQTHSLVYRTRFLSVLISMLKWQNVKHILHMHSFTQLHLINAECCTISPRIWKCEIETRDIGGWHRQGPLNGPDRCVLGMCWSGQRRFSYQQQMPALDAGRKQRFRQRCPQHRVGEGGGVAHIQGDAKKNEISLGQAL